MFENIKNLVYYSLIGDPEVSKISLAVIKFFKNSLFYFGQGEPYEMFWVTKNLQ